MEFLDWLSKIELIETRLNCNVVVDNENEEMKDDSENFVSLEELQAIM